MLKGRTFDNQLLDMVEFGVENYHSIESIKVRWEVRECKCSKVVGGPPILRKVM